MMNTTADVLRAPRATTSGFDLGTESALGMIGASRVHWDHPRTALGVRVMADYAVASGYSREAVLVSTGLLPEELDRRDTLITASQEIAATRNLLALFKNRPGLGLEVGREFHLTTYGLFGFALLSSPRIVDMMRTALRLMGLTFAFPAFSAEITPDGRFSTRLSGQGVPEDVKRFLVERELAATLNMHNELFAGNSGVGPLLSVHSEFSATHSDPPFGVPVEFGARETAIVFEREYLTQELPQACPETAGECIAQCETILSERLNRRGTAAAVQARLRRLGGREDGIAAVARELHMTERTLRRKLTTEGVSYRQIVDEVRAVITKELLTVQKLTATEAAYRLGFSDLSSFLRAQSRWAETVPGFRRD